MTVQLESSDIARAARVEYIDQSPVHRDTNWAYPSRGNSIEQLEACGRHREDRHIVAAGVHHEQAAIVITQDHRSLIAEPSSGTQPASGESRRRAQAPIPG